MIPGGMLRKGLVDLKTQQQFWLGVLWGNRVQCHNRYKHYSRWSPKYTLSTVKVITHFPRGGCLMFMKEGCCLQNIFSQRRKDLSPVRTNTHATLLEHLHQLARQQSVHLCSPRNQSNTREALCHCSQELDYFKFGKRVLSQNSAKPPLAVWTSLWISLPYKSSAEAKSIFAISTQQLLSTRCFQPSFIEAVAKCSNILDTLSLIQREV